MPQQDLAILRAYTTACAETDHLVCQDPSACTQMAIELMETERTELLASAYDARRIALESRGQLPDPNWLTSELIVGIEDLLRSQPNIDGPFRSIAITTGLARLAERGLPPDWLVREQIGPSLIRRIILTATSVWHRIFTGELEREQVPELHGWLSSIDADAPDDYRAEHDHTRLIVKSLAGNTFERGSTWIKEASLSDIAAWRVHGYTCSPPEIDDMALPGGRAASHWIYERFSRTYHSDWSPESWAWEASLIEHPSATSNRAGIQLATLQERVTTNSQLTRAASAFVLEDLGEVLPGISRSELVELVAHHLDRGQHSEARALSLAAYSENPKDNDVRAIYAFSWLPLEPRRSREIISETGNTKNMSSAVRDINLATSFLIEGNLDGARSTIAGISTIADGSDVPAWLWDPKSLTSHPQVAFMSPTTWIESSPVSSAAGQQSLASEL